MLFCAGCRYFFNQGIAKFKGPAQYSQFQNSHGIPELNLLDSGEFYVLKLHKWTIFPTEKSNIRENLNIS
jgi:hypothetical protein